VGSSGRKKGKGVLVVRDRRKGKEEGRGVIPRFSIIKPLSPLKGKKDAIKEKKRKTGSGEFVGGCG